MTDQLTRACGRTPPAARNARECACCGAVYSRRSFPDGLCGDCETGRCDSARDAICFQCGAAYPHEHDLGGLCDACNSADDWGTDHD
jgi:hypothetical protein